MTSNEQDICVPEDFLAHLIHNLKAPVVTIGGFARRLIDGKMGDLWEHCRGDCDSAARNNTAMPYRVVKRENLDKGS